MWCGAVRCDGGRIQTFSSELRRNNIIILKRKRRRGRGYMADHLASEPEPASTAVEVSGAFCIH